MISGGNATYDNSVANAGGVPVFNYRTPDYLSALSDGACASAYFTGYWSCDFAQGRGQSGVFADNDQTYPSWHGPWVGMDGAQFNGESLLVRTASVSAPEPATLALFGLGLAGLGLTRRKQSGHRFTR